jgi:hypothetical protein
VRRWFLVGFAAALAVAAGERGLRPSWGFPGYLPPDARKELGDRMRTHAEDLVLLSRHVVELSYDDVEQLARRIGGQPGIGRPAQSKNDPLSSVLPDSFFDLQDRMSNAARDLATTARERDDEAMAAAYGRLAQTCVACHSAYLKGKR